MLINEQKLLAIVGMAEVRTSMSSCKKRKEHKEEKPSRLKADELAVERVVTILSMWHHPSSVMMMTH